MASFFEKLFGTKPTIASSQEAMVGLAVLGTDMHSHLLPGLDDGTETLEQAVELVKAMQQLGYRKLVMTPHIMGDFYRNTPEGVRGALSALRKAVAAAGVTGVELDCAAEYYLDEWFGQKMEAKEPLLSFGGDKNYVLVETSYINEPFNFADTMFQLKAYGYQPVLAHPERYTYLYGRFEQLESIRESGVLLQVNLNSLAGYYSAGAKRVAEKMIDAGIVDMLGTDAHHSKHTEFLRAKVLSSSYLQKALSLPLLNNTL
ncbi:capsular biosynthesis protein [Hymenobacter taeanensis]|uniref:protein-tyrosine-phosphatase n=1 Tax=Hymenobacter taeanensis TaxID=2735321 RepID=A0A6M6BDC0_9BACT|nr:MULTISPECIES: CpsB/CapC family capsule biosynthesis tyrosine phosphatase [Hymenobacter]QJX46217.1 capsular biosynthesis protein [Hymenobacter taeanensis]UOQ80072.1 capsular biosynthesis protein [Hymenobacter sp. 5414T-23]